MKTRLSIFIFAISFLRVFSNENHEIVVKDSIVVRNLKIGDVVPEFVMGRLLKDPRKIVRTSDFKDKLLIIDFWATTCGSCIAALPRLDSLQNTYGAFLQILPTTYESEKTIQYFYKNSKIGKKISLPTIVEDTILGKWFNHKTVGHQVWIYKNKIIAFTLEEYVDEKNIKAVLAGEKINLPIKDDFVIFDEKIPLLTINRYLPVATRPLEYSVIFGNVPNISPKRGMLKDSINKTIRSYCISSPIVSAYLYYWGIIDPSLIITQPNQIILEVQDRSKYLFNHLGYHNDWYNKNSFSYESITSDSGQSKIETAKNVISDLDRLLKLRGRWEKRQVKSLLLIRTTPLDKIKTKEKERLVDLENSIKKFRNASLSSNLVWQLNQYNDNPLVFDSTHYTNGVDLDLNIKSWTDIPSIREELRAYGLDLKEEYRTENLFILTEINKWLP